MVEKERLRTELYFTEPRGMLGKIVLVTSLMVLPMYQKYFRENIYCII